MITFETAIMIEVLKVVRLRRWFLWVCLIICPFISARSQSLPSDKHLVKKGETLYSICKKYNMSQQELIQLNPGVESGLREGVELWLRKSAVAPTIKPEPEIITDNNGKSHIVSAGDTWYSLAKKYGVTVEQLQKANASAGNELRPEQRIQIPNSLQELKPAKSAGLPSHTVAIMLPLYLDAPDSVSHKNRKFQKASVQFYRGALMALDSMERFGLDARVEFYDVTQDTNSVTRAVKKMGKTQPDICIGPLFKESVAKAIGLLGDSSTHFVMPVQLSPKVLLLDKDISKVIPGAASEWGYLASYLIHEEKLSECFLIQSGNQEDTKLLNAFKDEWRRNKGGMLTELNLREIADVERLKVMLPNLKNPVIIFPCSDESGIRKIITELGNYNMRLFGHEKWLPISEIILDIPLGFRVSALKSNYLDTTDPDVINWIENYRITYRSEPDEFAFLGYDVVMYYLCGLQQFGGAITENLNSIHAPLISHVFDFSPTGAESGFENRHTHIIAIGENGELNIVNE